jgi:hypothetical protein
MNSTADDLFYTETIDGRRGYITSTRADGRGEKDIYEIQNDYMNVNRGAILKGKVITLNNRPLPEDITITVACKDCGDQADRTVYPRVRDGVFMMNLESCHEYEIIFHHTNGGVEFYREPIKTDCLKEKEEIYREVYLDADLMAIVTPPTPDTVVVDTVVPQPTYPPLAYKRNFGYNKNNGEDENGSLGQFYKNVEKQLESGREKIVIEIYSSASYVPTKKFKDNQELSQTRADNLQKKVAGHFKNAKYAGKVEIKIVSVVVSGPEYVNDGKNQDKYIPFQFVALETK